MQDVADRVPHESHLILDHEECCGYSLCERCWHRMLDVEFLWTDEAVAPCPEFKGIQVEAFSLSAA